MTIANYYGISGLSSDVKFGKTGGYLTYDVATQTFLLKQNNSSLYSTLSAGTINAVSGDINIVTGKLSINGATLEYQQPAVLKFGGNQAVMIPAGNNSTRPLTALVGMIRINTQSTVNLEYFDGSNWQVTGGNALQLTGGTMTGDIVMSNEAKVKGLPTPVDSGDAVPKNYVDNLVSGLSWKQAVESLSTDEVNVLSPVSASMGGATLSAGNRVLLTNQTDSSQNGIWVFNGVGLPMNRALDCNTPTSLNGAAVFVMAGTQADTGWTQTATLTVSFIGQIWVQFTGGSAYAAGTALSLVGNTFNVNIGSGLTLTGSGNGAISVYPEFGTAIQINAFDQVTLVLDTDSGLTQSASGLRIGNASVTNDMLAGLIDNSKLLNSSFTLSDGTTTDQLPLGETLTITGSGPVTTELTDNVVTVNVATATTATQGVASFNSVNFSVSAGEVAVKTIDAGLF